MPRAPTLSAEPHRQLPFRHPLFEVTTLEQDNVVILRLEGELDLSQCVVMERAIEMAEAGGAERILLDLGQLAFLDAAGLHTIHAACRRSAINGNRLRVTRGNSRTATILGLVANPMSLPFDGLETEFADAS